MDIKKFHESQRIRIIVIGILIFIFVIMIFEAGVFIGYRKAAFSFQMGNNYYHAFGQKNNQFVEGLYGRDLPGGNGAVGKIVRISLPTIVVASPDGVEKDVIVGTSTVFRRFRDTVSISDLKVDDFIVVIGSPNSLGRVEAKFIRVMPAFDNDADNIDSSSSKKLPPPPRFNFE